MQAHPSIPPPGWGGEPRPNSREQAIASAVQAAANAAAISAAADWEAAEKSRAMDARKVADQAAAAVDDQVGVAVPFGIPLLGSAYLTPPSVSHISIPHLS